MSIPDFAVTDFVRRHLTEWRSSGMFSSQAQPDAVLNFMCGVISQWCQRYPTGLPGVAASAHLSVAGVRQPSASDSVAASPGSATPAPGLYPQKTGREGDSLGKVNDQLLTLSSLIQHERSVSQGIARKLDLVHEAAQALIEESARIERSRNERQEASDALQIEHHAQMVKMHAVLTELLESISSSSAGGPSGHVSEKSSEAAQIVPRGGHLPVTRSLHSAMERNSISDDSKLVRLLQIVEAIDGLSGKSDQRTAISAWELLLVECLRFDSGVESGHIVTWCMSDAAMILLGQPMSFSDELAAPDVVVAESLAHLDSTAFLGAIAAPHGKVVRRSCHGSLGTLVKQLNWKQHNVMTSNLIMSSWIEYLAWRLRFALERPGGLADFLKLRRDYVLVSTVAQAEAKPSQIAELVRVAITLSLDISKLGSSLSTVGEESLRFAQANALEHGRAALKRLLSGYDRQFGIKDQTPPVGGLVTQGMIQSNAVRFVNAQGQIRVGMRVRAADGLALIGRDGVVFSSADVIVESDAT